MKNRFHSLFVILLFTIASFNINGQNAVIPGEVRLDATFNNIGVNYAIDGDDNLNSELQIRYRLQGLFNYSPAATTMRAHPGLIIDGLTTSRNYHAGSVLFLEPGTTYEVECILTDIDGGSLTTTHTITTKTIPEPAANATIHFVVPGNGGGSGTSTDPYLGLQSAANNAQAGDHFIVGSGNYDPFTLTTSGTADNPISFISETQHGAIINGNGTSSGIVNLGDFSTIITHVIIDGFRIENGNYGIDAQNTQFVTVRNNIIQNVGWGYYNRRELGNEHDQYITNNLMIGTTSWPQSGTPNERGVDIRGNNNVVSFNTIIDFADGISTDGEQYEISYSLDIHNNEISNAVDDLIEVDGTISNTRVYANRCFNGRAGVSLAPIDGGPTYVFRNILFNMENSAFKMNRGPSGMMIVHNTCINDENVVESPDGWQNTLYRNNVMMGSRYCFELFNQVPGSIDDWDYDAFYSTRAGDTGTEWFKWNNIRYAGVTELQNSGLLELNAIGVLPSDFENIFIPDPFPVAYNTSQINTMPIQSSPVINTGAMLDNLNNSFVSDGMPDRGALEFGIPIPQYGHDFGISTDVHIYMEQDFIEIYPNPFTDKVVLDGDFTNFTIQVLDVSGQLVADHSSVSAPFEIDLTTLPSGTYFVNVSSLLYNQLSVYKIIKQ